MTVPTFAVVGRPNKGKSSIVATLARDDLVHIAPTAGTTREARRFPMSINDELLYVLVDTPGIQRARSILGWLKRHNTNAASRPETVKRFVQEHANNHNLRYEYQALKPVVDGAGIIYVVDGSYPFGADYEAEMEILRWCGRPSMALINPIESDRYVDQWVAGLGQYFQIVRGFDAHRAEIQKQFDLLELFGHLDTEWREPLKRAVTILKEERYRQHQQACIEITSLIMDCVGYQIGKSIPEGMPEEAIRQALSAQYRYHLVNRERQCRKRVEEFFNYSNLQKSERRRNLDDSELFDVKKWYLWGLNKFQLIIVAALSGAILGGTLGGITIFVGSPYIVMGIVVGAIVGAVISAIAAWSGADRIGKIRVKGIPTGGKRLSYGPSNNINFPFVLLGRALLHHQLVSKRTHAAQDKLDLDQPPLDWIEGKERRKLKGMFDDIKNGKRLAKRRAQLEGIVLERCLAVDNPPAI